MIKTIPAIHHSGAPNQLPVKAMAVLRTPLSCLAFSLALLISLPESCPAHSTGKPDNAEAAEAALNNLEAALVATLDEATFIGRWHPIADGEVGDEQSDQYSIAGAEKIAGNRWIIRARLREDMPNLIIPVPLRIEWAGDTPVLIVDNFGLPGMNRYSARVLIFDDTYAGTWSGGGMAGLLSGIIVRDPVDPADPETNAADNDPPADPAALASPGRALAGVRPVDRPHRLHVHLRRNPADQDPPLKPGSWHRE